MQPAAQDEGVECFGIAGAPWQSPIAVPMAMTGMAAAAASHSGPMRASNISANSA